MYKKVLSCVGNYKKYAILTPVTIIGEVVMEVLIPTVMALIIDNGIRQGDIGYVVKMGLVMMLMAALFRCSFGTICSCCRYGIFKKFKEQTLPQGSEFLFCQCR